MTNESANPFAGTVNASGGLDQSVRVLNKRWASPDAQLRAVYVGRGSCWGNRYRIGLDGDRAAVIAAYQWWLRSQHQLLARLDELSGRNLLCWCAPLPCHADLLLWLANTGTEQRQEWLGAATGAAAGDGGVA